MAVVGIVGTQILHTSFDLTAEKRHTLSEGSQQLLDKIDERALTLLLHVICMVNTQPNGKDLNLLLRRS